MQKINRDDKIEIDALACKLYLMKRENAISRGLAFDLSLQSIKNLLRTKKCPYTGITLQLYKCTTGAVPNDAVSIERVDGTKGYIKGNVIAVSKIANKKRGNLSIKQIDAMHKVFRKRGLL